MLFVVADRDSHTFLWVIVHKLGPWQAQEYVIAKHDRFAPQKSRQVTLPAPCFRIMSGLLLPILHVCVTDRMFATS